MCRDLTTAPSRDLLVIRRNQKTGERSLYPLRWCLITGATIPNGAASRSMRKPRRWRPCPSFGKPYRERRCMVPVDGLFEWKAIKGQKLKQPYATTMTEVVHLSEATQDAAAGEHWCPGLVQEITNLEQQATAQGVTRDVSDFSCPCRAEGGGQPQWGGPLDAKAVLIRLKSIRTRRQHELAPFFSPRAAIRSSEARPSWSMSGTYRQLCLVLRRALAIFDRHHIGRGWVRRVLRVLCDHRSFGLIARFP